jgi:UDP-glucuronate 4-epimerase
VWHYYQKLGITLRIERLPKAYIDANIIGFINILEACRYNKVNNLSYASSSSVYGLNESYPFATSDNVDHPISRYAASKKSYELMAHTYSHLYGIATTGLRFFYSLRSMGKTGYGALLVYQSCFGGQSH